MFLMFFLILFAHEIRWESIEVVDNADYINIQFTNHSEEQCFVYPLAPKPYYRATYVLAPRATIHTTIFKCHGCCRHINPMKLDRRILSNHVFQIFPGAREDQYSEAINMTKSAYLMKECDRLFDELGDEKALDEFLKIETDENISKMVESEETI